MIKKLRVTVDGKPYDVTVEVPDESDGTTVPAAEALPKRPLLRPLTLPLVAQPKPVQQSRHSVSREPLLRSDCTLRRQFSSGPGDVPSPLAGRVIEIAVKPGQEVNANDHLITLEAMKMNTFVLAPRSGKVAEIKVAVGDAVGEGQVLVKIS